MRNIKLGESDSVTIYASAKEMTISRYTNFQKYLLLDSGVGSTIESVSTHFSKLHSFLTNGMVEDAVKEAENLHYNFWSIIESIDFESLAFACMIHAINGEPITDTSEDNLKLVLLRLSDLGLTREAVENEVDDIKKKINDELGSFFPDKNSDAESFEFYTNLQRKIMLTADVISTSENKSDILKAIQDIERFFAESSRPKEFRPGSKDNAVMGLEVNFEYLCSLLEMNGVQEPKKLTIIEFYSRLEYFKNVHSKNPKL